MAIGVGEETPVITELPLVLRVVEGTLAVDTNDRMTALIAFTGFQYLLALEFARQQPALALLYDFNVQATTTERGSFRISFKIWVSLKSRVAAEVKKAGAVAILGVALAIPGAFNEGSKIYQDLFPPVQNQLQHDLRSCSPVIQIADIRPPGDGEIFFVKPRRSFDL